MIFLSRVKNLLQGFLVVFLLVLLVNYSFYLVYLNKLSKRLSSEEHIPIAPQEHIPVAPQISKEDAMVLGVDLYTPIKSHFSNFTKQKPLGTIRIGSLGASWTRSWNYVGENPDWSSRLQELFRRNGYSQLEVINFGIPAHGLEGTHMLWNILSKKYDLDYLIIGPRSYLHMLSFEFPFSFWPRYASRYIVEDQKLVRIDVIGSSYAERFYNYNSFIPKWRYLRYSREAPAFLRAIVPIGRTMDNPFYYTKLSLEEEKKQISKLIFEDFSRSGKQIIYFDVLGYDSIENAAASEIDKPNFFTSNKFYSSLKFPYHGRGFPNKSASHHPSRMGYSLIAEQLFDVLRGHSSSQFDFIRTREIEQGEFSKMKNNQTNKSSKALSDFKKIYFTIDDRKLGEFSSISDSDFANSLSFKNEKIVSLLGIRTADVSPLDACYLSLPFRIKQGAQLLLETDETSPERVSLGKTNLLHPALSIAEMKMNIYCIDIPRKFRNEIFRAEFRIPLTEDLKRFVSKNVPYLLKLDTLNIGKAKLDSTRSELVLQTNNPELYIIRSKADDFLETNNLKSNGIVKLVAEGGKRRKTKIPFARWNKATKTIKFSEENRAIQKPIRKFTKYLKTENIRTAPTH